MGLEVAGRGCWGVPSLSLSWCQGSRQGWDGLPTVPTRSPWVVWMAAPGREAGREPRVYGRFCSQNRLVENCSCNLCL